MSSAGLSTAFSSESASSISGRAKNSSARSVRTGTPQRSSAFSYGSEKPRTVRNSTAMSE